MNSFPVAPRQRPEHPWGNACGLTKTANEVGKIPEADIEGNVGDGPFVVRKKTRSVAKPDPEAIKLPIQSAEC